MNQRTPLATYEDGTVIRVEGIEVALQADEVQDCKDEVVYFGFTEADWTVGAEATYFVYETRDGWHLTEERPYTGHACQFHADNAVKADVLGDAHDLWTAPEPVTAEDVEALLTSGSMEPTLVRWRDTGEVEVVSGVLFSDISWSYRHREREVLATAAELRGTGHLDNEHPTQDDYEALAEYLNENA